MTITTTIFQRISPTLLLTLGVVAATVITGCRSEMYDMEYGEPLEQSNFYPDKRMSRPLVEGTVARQEMWASDPKEHTLLYTGTNADGSFSDVFPMEVTTKVMHRGQERYNIFCSPCHGQTGSGNGMIVQRGMKQPPSFHEQRLRESPPGYFYSVITNGFGVMYSYASRIKPEDRWAIIAYLRALQKSQAGAAAPQAAQTAPAQTEATEAEAANTTEADTSASQ